MTKQKSYGIVEGFSSEPLAIWSDQERSNTIGFVRTYAQKMNTYVYCPKDDPYITTQWGKLYTESDADKLKRFMAECADAGITYFYGLNPSLRPGDSWLDVQNDVLAKLRQVMELDCKNIMLLFDDIPLAYDVADNQELAAGQYEGLVQLVNSVYQRLQSQLDDFWFCSPDYCFRKVTPLTMAMRALNPAIGVVWTGNQIFSKTVIQVDVDRVRRILQKNARLIYWSNYPVNDFEQAAGTFNLGGFYPIKPEVARQLTAVLVNPMRECYANLPFYCTFSDWAAGGPYDRKQSYKVACAKVLGLSAGVVGTISSLSSRNIVDSKRRAGPGWAKSIDTKVGSLSKFSDLFVGSVERLFKDAEAIRAVVEKIRTDKKVTKSDLKAFDWFPTKTYVPRYLTEVSNIVVARLRLYKARLPGALLKQLRASINKSCRYKGAARLSINKNDTVQFLVTIKRIVDAEQQCFIDFLNNPAVTKAAKIGLVLKRRDTNRFTCR